MLGPCLINVNGKQAQGSLKHYFLVQKQPHYGCIHNRVKSEKAEGQLQQI